MNIKGGTHLKLEDRIKIQEGLGRQLKLKLIAADVNSDPRTVSKEIKKRRVMEYNRKCIYASTSKDMCKKVLRFPFVCNGCKDKSKCTNLHFFSYNAVKAQEHYRQILVECRQGMDMTLDEKNTVDAILKEGSDRGQSVCHIYNTHKDDIVCSQSTLYRMIENGTTITQKIDTIRSAKLKPRKHYARKITKDLKIYKGRSYTDFISYISVRPIAGIVEFDTVEDPTNGAEKTLLTIHFTAMHFMIIRLIKAKTKSEVDKQFIWLRYTLGDAVYARMMDVCLTDRGGEFVDPDVIEGTLDGEQKLGSVFFCNSYSSYQKGAIEENHRLIRYVLPKGTYFSNLTQKKVDLMASHINSYYRDSIGTSPFRLFLASYGKNVLDKLGISEIPGKLVLLKSTLLK